MTTAVPLELMPIWLFFLVACVIIVVPLEIGLLLGRRRPRRGQVGSDASLGVILGSILGLVAFLLAFTFNMAANRYEERRDVVLEEANAIGTAYLRSALLPAEQQEGIHELFRDYVDLRLAAAQAKVSRENLEGLIERSEAIHAELWNRAVAAADTQPGVMTSLFIQALNDVIDIHAQRVQVGIRSTVPLSIWLGLVTVAGIGLLTAGYHVGTSGQGRNFAGIGLVLAFASALTLIADLDHPVVGLLRTTQAAMEDLKETMDVSGGQFAAPAGQSGQ